MKINANIAALQAFNSITNSGKSLTMNSDRLSSGSFIRKSGDDPAGMAISSKIRAQSKGIEEASKNSSNGISLVQTAEGGLTEIQNMLQRIRELSVQAANDSNALEDREKLQIEVDQLREEINATSFKTEYNQIKVLHGEAQKGLNIQVGQNKDMALNISIPKISSQTLGITSVDLTTAQGCQDAIVDMDKALSKISDLRSKLGAYQNRMEYTIKNLDAQGYNAEQSLSRIADTDMAKEMAEYSKNNVIYQAGISVLAQANQRPQSILQLIQ